MQSQFDPLSDTTVAQTSVLHNWDIYKVGMGSADGVY